MSLGTAETFDLDQYLAETLAGVEGDPLASPDGRRILTERDPLLFALLYLGHHLRSDATGGRITFSDAHLAWIERAAQWVDKPEVMAESRHAEIAPRETGKSTWWFLILPLWAAAHGHVRFAAAFADSATQAEGHLETFTKELDNNDLLRQDYPELVAPKLKAGGRYAVARNRGMWQSRSGFVFAARGIDSGTLGLKVGEARPDLLVLDDVEPGESGYSADQAAKRLSTIVDVILPLNSFARVVVVGTVTMPGSIIHQLVRAARGQGEPEEWIGTEGFQPHYFAPILTRDDGTERSVWPARWPLEYLNALRHTRAYAKNFANDPLGLDGDYWTLNDFTRGELEGVTRVLVSIDPAVTTKASSDYTGIAVVGYAPSSGRCIVLEAYQVKLSGAAIRRYVMKLIERREEEGSAPVGLVLVETNQGGDVWREILHGLPVRVRTVQQTEKKEVRAAHVLNHYQLHPPRVIHAPGLVLLEEQMVAFPDAPHDDMVDAAGSGIAYFLQRTKRRKAGVARVASYG